MSNYRFPASLKPITTKGYSYQRGGNVYRSEVTGGLPRQGRDTYFDTVPFTVTLVTSALGNQAFQSFLNQISGGADSFVMALDSGLGVKDHQCQINSDINIDTSDGINWTISFSLLAERTDIQEETCLTANLPDLFGCYGDGLNCFLAAYATAQTTFPRVWEPNVIAQFNAVAREFVGIGFSRASEGTYIDELGRLQTAADDIPRYESEGLLLEPETSNTVLNSMFTGTGWLFSRVNVVYSDWDIGREAALTRNTAGAAYCYRPSVSYTAGIWTFSGFAKASGTASTVEMAVSSGVSGNATGSVVRFNLTTESITITLGAAFVTLTFLEPLANGWFRVGFSAAIAGTVTPGAQTPFAIVESPVGASMSFTGFQAEKQQYPTSYVPTSGVTSGRSSDVLTLQVTGAKRVYREYTPLGSSTPVTETVPYTGELCPPGHVRVIKVLND